MKIPRDTGVVSPYGAATDNNIYQGWNNQTHAVLDRRSPVELCQSIHRVKDWNHLLRDQDDDSGVGQCA